MQIRTEYRTSEREQEREQSLLELIGEGDSVLEIGPDDGYYTNILARRFRRVVALDLVKPDVPGVENVQGDARDLQFPDRSFDVVLASEVLEHIPGVEKAAAEIARVARDRVVIGVPYKQDIRAGRVTCWNCGHIDPPWGHVNSFDEQRLAKLFPGLQLLRMEFIGTTNIATTSLATWLMDKAGNPWGAYVPGSCCSSCGTRYQQPSRRSLPQKALAKAAHSMNVVRQRFEKPHPNWIHALYTS